MSQPIRLLWVCWLRTWQLQSTLRSVGLQQWPWQWQWHNGPTSLLLRSARGSTWYHGWMVILFTISTQIPAILLMVKWSFIYCIDADSSQYIHSDTVMTSRNETQGTYIHLCVQYYVYMYILFYIRVHIILYIHVPIILYTHTHTHTHTYVYIYTYIHTCIALHTHISWTVYRDTRQKWLCMRRSSKIHACIHIHAYMPTYMHTYINVRV
jgi:hypothetical protein